jgi:hypothetical protein
VTVAGLSASLPTSRMVSGRVHVVPSYLNSPSSVTIQIEPSGASAIELTNHRPSCVVPPAGPRSTRVVANVSQPVPS